MARAPRRQAVLRGFMALALDMARIDPERPPSPEVARWYRELAYDIGVAPADVPTARDLVEEGLRLTRAVREMEPADPIGVA